MEFPDLATGLVFLAVSLALSVGVVHISGYFPVAGRKPFEDQLNLQFLLLVGILMIAGLILVGLALAVSLVGWALSVVIAGNAFLFSPVVVTALPVDLRDGPRGLLLVVLCSGAILALGLLHIGGP